MSSSNNDARVGIARMAQIAAILVGLAAAEVGAADPLCSLLGCGQGAGRDTPFQKSFSMSDAEECVSVTVPTGQRLTVKYVAGGIVVPGGRNLAGSISGVAGGEAIGVPFVFAREVLSSGAQDRMNVSQAASFYVDGGQELFVCLQVVPFDDSFEFFGNLGVTGTLEDLD